MFRRFAGANGYELLLELSVELLLLELLMDDELLLLLFTDELLLLLDVEDDEDEDEFELELSQSCPSLRSNFFFKIPFGPHSQISL